MTTGALALAAAAVLAFATPSLAEDACFACHEKPHPDGDYMPIVRQAAYAASVHANVPCDECHKAGQADGFDVVPHVLETQVGPGTAVIVTDRRALGVSPNSGGFVHTNMRVHERVERISTRSGVATVTTSQRVLIFQGTNARWVEQRRKINE